MPPTPLLTSDVLKEENELWPDVQEGMSLALREMRVDQVSDQLVNENILKTRGVFKTLLRAHASLSYRFLIFGQKINPQSEGNKFCSNDKVNIHRLR